MRLAATVAVSMMTLMMNGNVWAGSITDLTELNCGNKAIQIGMSPQDIKTICGRNWEPAFISKHIRPALHADEDGKVSNDYFEKWMYKAADKSDAHVLLKNGEVIRIFTTSQN
ncbi:DUF2845 domain-containing protein [Methylophaga sp. OBS4]|uniref:DUF2845 domain-containing protein n=1 Tax=Methylophaga sp. OBS4 TaxID=2991935 RepID=UPI0022537470|nr:DUF2845 domain-containing protein [Methylophaga sp. OBS4]MCX4188104.1 DUF2845 domain-containing protein [Methylophaga sp. OBS4]